MSEQPFRVAIIGAGMIAKAHVTQWRAIGNVEVAGVADINPEILEKFSTEHQIPNPVADYHDLLSRNDLDAIDICTPPWLHEKMAIEAVEAGKHAMVEKPFTIGAAAGERVVRAAQQAGKVVACRVGARRLGVQCRTMRNLIEAGTLGRIYMMKLMTRALYRPGIEYNPSGRWFLDKRLAGGGALYDWGVYDLDLLFGMFGHLPIVEVEAMTFRGVDDPKLDTPFDVEEHAAAWLRLADGGTIFWERAWATHLPPENRWDFYGTNAGASFVPHVDPEKMNLRLTRYAHRQPQDLPVIPLAEPGPNVYEDFVHACRTGSQPAVSAAEAVAMLRIIDAIYESAAQQKPVQINPA